MEFNVANLRLDLGSFTSSRRAIAAFLAVIVITAMQGRCPSKHQGVFRLTLMPRSANAIGRVTVNVNGSAHSFPSESSYMALETGNPVGLTVPAPASDPKVYLLSISATLLDMETRSTVRATTRQPIEIALPDRKWPLEVRLFREETSDHGTVLTVYEVASVTIVYSKWRP